MRKLTLLALLLAAAGCANQSTMVYKNDGARQCETGGTSLAQSRSTLTDAGIEVLGSHCGVMTGMAVMSVCGAATLGLHLHEISADGLRRAEQLGFADTQSLIDKEQRIGFEVAPCRDF